MSINRDFLPDATVSRLDGLVAARTRARNTCALGMLKD